MEPAQQQKFRVEVSHTLAQEQLNGIYESVYSTTKQAIRDARRDTEIENDIIYSKAALRRFLNNCSSEYVEELLSDETFPRGRTLSDRKQCFSKTAVKHWLLTNSNK
ncbi:hypothetical protein [Enterococcus sp. DIV0098]|uniref:hypothetical protein n=1 Tax=Enterococcus sp. DIV0098 TaxID=2774843 RepID=UPI003F228139